MARTSLDKSSNYRTKLYDSVDDDHLVKNGVKMQAHHLISADGVKNVENRELMIEAEYDINKLENLVFIPCTFDGACHLGVQLHRGNHTSTSDYSDLDEEYDDDEHPRDYHATVKMLVEEALQELSKDCIDKERERKTLLTTLDEISDDLVDMINRFSKKAQLTRVYYAFKKSGEYSLIGCSGATKMDDHREGVACPHDRDHADALGVAGIKKYVLRTGN